MAQNSLIRINLNSEKTTANEMLIMPSVTKSAVHQEDFIGGASKQTLRGCAGLKKQTKKK